MNGRIFLSGIAGYIGSVLANHLLNLGYSVIGVDNFYYNNQTAIQHLVGHPKFELHHMDLIKDADSFLLKELQNKCDILIPVAAYVGQPVCDKVNPDKVWQLNTHQVYDILSNRKDHQRVIYLNTNSAYGDSKGQWVDETSATNPISLYSITKCAAESEVLKEKNTICLRLATVFGASPRQRMDLLLNQLTALLYYDRKITIFEPHFNRNFVHVRDVVRAITHFFYAGNGVYNVGLDSANMSKLQLAKKICDKLGIDHTNIYIGDQVDLDRRNYLVSNKKLLDTGFKFNYSVEDGINEIITLCRCYRKEQLLKMGNV